MKKSIVYLLLPTLLFTACQSKTQKKESINTVKISVAQHYGAEKAVDFPGKVKSASEINLSFRIAGPISKIHVTEGQQVKKGAVIAEMDSRDYLLQLAATEAEYTQVKAEAERMIQLYQQQSTSQNNYDKAVAGLNQVTAKYNSHKNALADTKLIAPFNGYIQKRYFDAGETVSAGMPVFSLYSTDSPEVEINIPASEFIQREKFDTYSCTFDVYPDNVYPLELISISPKANLNQLYTVRLRLMSDPAKPHPSPGMSTLVTIGFKPQQAELITIPLTALFEVEGKSTVWVYDEKSQTIQARQIRLSEIKTTGFVVVAEGLHAGEQVISAGVHALKEGEKVKRIEPTTSTNVGGLL